jgi:multicomponent Na+:H+ antiporter subunit A
MWISGVVLAAFTVTLPLLLTALDPLVNSGVEAIRRQPAEVHLHLFEGITTPLILSSLSIALGVGMFVLRAKFIPILARLPELNPRGIYQWLFYRALPRGAERLTTRLQSGRLRNYLLIVFASLSILMIALIALGQLNLLNDESFVGFDPGVAFVCALLIIGAIAGLIAPTRLSAIVVLGIEGALLSLLFALFGAPDVAFTQLMFEVIALVLFVLAFHFLPDAFSAPRSRTRQTVDTVFSILAGLTVTLLILGANANPIASPISGWYVANAESIGHGHNVVNVILVDFRGLDTQMEIVVLLIAAIGVTALLRLRPSGQSRGQYLPPTEDQPSDIALPVDAEQHIQVEETIR